MEWDDEVEVVLGDLGFDGARNTFDVAATVTNTSHEAWSSPVALVLSTAVDRRPTLVNADGHTAEGFPFVIVPVPAAGLAPGESATLRLEFADQAQARLPFTPLIWRLRLPVANAGSDVSARVSMPMTIDGSKSYDPDGELITFHWTIAQAPAGSTATLDPADPAPAFVPDVPGTYLLQLLVVNEDGITSLPARVVVEAFAGNAPPNARAGRERRAPVGSPVDLDASRSFDPEGAPLSFRWSLVSVPRGSKLADADLMLRETATPWFTPDLAGAYQLVLRASHDASIGEDRVRVIATQGRRALTADAGRGPQLVHGSPIHLNGSVGADRRADASPLAYAWRLVTRPATSALTSASIAGADASIAHVSPDVDGAYVFRFTASDGEQRDADNILVRFSRDAAQASVDEAKAAVTAAAVTMPLLRRDPDRRGSSAFELSVTPGTLRITAGARGTYAVGLEARDPWRHVDSSATLSVAGLPRGVTAVFAAPSLVIPNQTTLRLSTAANVPAGRYPLLVTASGLINGVVTIRSASVMLQVTERFGAPEPAPLCAGAAPPNGTAIYVSPAGSDAPGCGQSATTPCATIQQGIDNCSASGCSVLVRYGRYATSATIVLKEGVSVYGSCVFSGVPTTNPTAANYRTMIDANPAPGTPAMSASSINTATTVSGVVVIGKEETGTGTASIAMAVSDSKGLVLSRSVLAAGRGGDASAGTSSSGAAGGTGNSPSDSSTGGSGGLACPSNPTGGPGNGGQGADQKSVSLSGCFVWCVCNETNFPNSLGRGGAASGVVAGGGGAGGSGDGCGCNGNNGVPDGNTGGAGNPGACATQGGVASPQLFGSFNGVTWMPGVGGTGGAGAVGSGGGGGGSGGMSALTRAFQSPLSWAGLPGGGGGGGGCGGPGGTGGQQGGASVALVLVNSTIANLATQNSVIPGPGGMGGSGGQGGVGGSGGSGAAGMAGHGTSIDQTLACSAKVPGSGGAGAQGGQGGAGGGGAGGNGGPSIGVALVGPSPDPGNAGIYDGLRSVPGPKGPGGQNAPQPVVQPNPCTGAGGSDGVPGGSAPVVPFGTLRAGQQLTPGQQLMSPNRSTVLAMQTDSNLCLYVQSQFAWCNFTQGKNVQNAIMQSDGNLCVYAVGGGSPLWCSGTGGHPGAYLDVQDNGQAVIYDGSTPLWTVP